jgi:hypothetical protein
MNAPPLALVYVSVSTAIARVLAFYGYWSVDAGEPRGDLARLLPGAPWARLNSCHYECTPAQATTLLAWLDALGQVMSARSAPPNERIAIGQWRRRVREAIAKGTPTARALKTASQLSATAIQGCAPSVIAQNTPQGYAQHCMRSVRELVDFAQGSAWESGANPWQGE